MTYFRRRSSTPAHIAAAALPLVMCLAAAPAAPSPSLYYALSGRVSLDSNVPRDTTEKFGWYAAPSVFLRGRPLPDYDAFSLWADVCYENHVKGRSALFADPFFRGGISVKPSGTKFSTEIACHYLAYLDPGMHPERQGIRLVAEGALKAGRHRPALNTYVMWNDYAYSGFDGVRYRARFSYAFRFKRSRSRAPALCEAGARFCVQRNDARIEKYSYSRHWGGPTAEFRLRGTELSMASGLMHKVYDTARSPTITGEPITPRNRYLFVVAEISASLFAAASFESGARLVFKQSNYPDFDYDYHRVFFRLTWTGWIPAPS